MAEKVNWRQIDRFIMNNCKIADELRNYRDLAGRLNQVSLSGERVKNPSDSADYAEYFISETLSYLDIAVANAAYTLMVSSPVQTSFQADVIGQLMAGNMGWRIPKKMKQDLEARLQKLAQTQIYILADHDHQVEQDLYEGMFLPVRWENEGDRIKFHFLPELQMPLYQYAGHRRQLIEIPLSRLRDDQGGSQIQHNNTDRMLALRHYLLQELEILRYANNKVYTHRIQLLKKDDENNEMGLLWLLGMIGDAGTTTVKDPITLAKRLQKFMQQLLDNWHKCGYLGSLQYEMLSAKDGFGVQITSRQ